MFASRLAGAGLVLLALAAVVAGYSASVRATNGFDNYNPFLTLDVDPTTDYAHIAFSPRDPTDPSGRHFGLAMRTCLGVNSTTTCGSPNMATDLTPLLIQCSSQDASGWSSIVVQDVTLQVDSSSNGPFAYVLYTEWIQTPGNPDPNQNTMALLYCNTSDCSQGLSSQAIIDNGYAPSLVLIKSNLLGAAKKPVIAYVATQGIVNPLPSEEGVGDAYMLFCGDVACADPTKQTLLKVDKCKGSGNYSLCSGTAMSVDNNGCPQLLYFGPSSQGQAGSWVKVASCADSSANGCQCPTMNVFEIQATDANLTPFAGEGMIITRAAGHPAFVFTDSAGDSLFLSRCSDYMCNTTAGAVTTTTLATATGNSFITSPSMTVLDNQLAVIVYGVTTPQGLAGLQRDLYVIYCTTQNCNAQSAPTLITPSGQAPIYPQVYMLPNEQVAIVYYDETSMDGYLIVCDENQCEPSEISASQAIGTADLACFPYAPSPPGPSPRRKKGGSNAGAIVAGVILSLVFLCGVGVFAYWFMVIRPGGQWPWAKLQAKGLDQYAEL